ncbi:RHS repeat-associated core domain-containing protein [Curtobacterium sp. 24E2]|nr:hypothetical protein JN350_00700 [Curtobacterium sp. 24E2]
MLLGGPPASRKALADPDEPVRSTSNGDGSITLGADGRPLEADDGAGGLTRLRPDLAGHPAEDRPFWRRTTLATDQLGRRISRTFDDQGNLAVLGGAVRTFAHDALSRLQGVTDPAGATSRRPSTRRAFAGSFSRDVATAETILVNGLDGAPRSSTTSAGAWRQSQALPAGPLDASTTQPTAAMPSSGWIVTAPLPRRSPATPRSYRPGNHGRSGAVVVGRGIRRTAVDGSTTEYAWSDLGYLAAVVDRDASYAETGRLDVWVDVLGELAEVAGVAAWWDSAAVVPSLIRIADTSLLDLPGGVTAFGDAVTEPAWRSARATDAADPWAALAAVTDVGLPAGVALTGSGGVSVAGLEWLGARVYDPAVRGFLSVDPLAPILGAAWSGNPYSYAGNDPLQAVDPLGLRPATDKDLQAYRDANQGAIAAAGKWIADHKEAILATAMIVGAVALRGEGATLAGTLRGCV